MGISFQFIAYLEAPAKSKVDISNFDILREFREVILISKTQNKTIEMSIKAKACTDLKTVSVTLIRIEEVIRVVIVISLSPDINSCS